MRKIEVKCISDFCNVTSSKRIYKADYQPEGVPFYRAKEISEKHNGKELSDHLFISREKFETLRKKFGAPQDGDLLLTSIGALLGEPYVVSNDGDFYFKDGNLTWFRNFTALNSSYLYYWLISPQGKAQLSTAVIGAAQPAFTIAALKKMSIGVPNVSYQSKVVAILSAYDDLIENNTRRIAILEEMAQAIYREWFVNFRFPGHENVKLVDSPLGQIPEGWEVGSVGDFGTIITGKTPSKKRPELFGGDIPFVRTPDMHGNLFCLTTTDTLTEEGMTSQPRQTIPVDSICISCIGTVGVISITASECQTNQQINTIIPSTKLWREYIVACLFENSPRLKQMGAGGATMDNISKGKLTSFPVVLPPESIVHSFSDYSCDLFDRIKLLQRQNITLRHTRDLLLPKLISGKLDVEDLDIDLGITDEASEEAAA